MADPDLELRGAPVFCRLPFRLFVLLQFFFFFFLPKIRGAPPLDPPLEIEDGGQ